MAGDYGGAVADGKVVDERELAEQLEVVAEARRIADHLGGLGAVIDGVRAVMEAHGPQTAVAAAVSRAESELRARFDLADVPERTPSFERGREIFAEHCAPCHGATGFADTERAAQYTPRPANFHDPRVAGPLSPFRIFTTVRFGVPNTAMVPFSTFSDEARWSVAFYAATLDHAPAASGAPEARLFSLAELARESDDDLRAALREAGVEEARVEASLAVLRTRAPYETVQASSSSTLILARADLVRAASLYDRQEREDATAAVVNAYLDGVEPVEAMLRDRDGALARHLEETFRDLRAAMAKRAPKEDVRTRITGLLADIARAERALDAAKDGEGAFLRTLVSSAGIALREGVEAALLLAALLAVAEKTGNRERKRFIHMGWLAALFAGGLTWVITTRLTRVSGLSRETIEGVTALLAAVVLFYVSYWLFARQEATRWLAFLKSRAGSQRAALSLFGIAFLAAYREAFETVIFFQALVADAGAPRAAWLGIVLGVFLLLVLVLVYGRAGRFTPPRPFFTFSSALLYALCVVFCGQGIAALQTAGHLPLHALDGPHVPALGIYPTVETSAAQLALVAAGVLAAIVSRRRGTSGRKATAS